MLFRSRIYQQSPQLERDIPTLAFFTRPLAEIEDAALQAQRLLRDALGPAVDVTVDDGASQVGSGALPIDTLPTKVVALRSRERTPDQLAAWFRSSRPPIVGRIADDRFLLDMRTVLNPADVIPHH